MRKTVFLSALLLTLMFAPTAKSDISNPKPPPQPVEYYWEMLDLHLKLRDLERKIYGTPKARQAEAKTEVQLKLTPLPDAEQTPRFAPFERRRRRTGKPLTAQGASASSLPLLVRRQNHRGSNRASPAASPGKRKMHQRTDRPVRD